MILLFIHVTLHDCLNESDVGEWTNMGGGVDMEGGSNGELSLAVPSYLEKEAFIVDAFPFYAALVLNHVFTTLIKILLLQV